LNLDVGIGTGEHGEFSPVLRGDVEFDLFKPPKRVANFVQGDIEHLPFRTRAFETVYGFNVLEHIPHPYEGLKEMIRVGRTVVVRQDLPWNIGSYATSSHLWFQLPGLRFLPYPRTRVGIMFSRWLRRLIDLKLEWKRGRVFSFGPLFKFLMSERFQYKITYESKGSKWQ
jgi:Methyltransferase domain